MRKLLALLWSGIVGVVMAPINLFAGLTRAVFGDGGRQIQRASNPDQGSQEPASAPKLPGPHDGANLIQRAARRLSLGLELPDGVAKRMGPEHTAWLKTLNPDQLEALARTPVDKITAHLDGSKAVAGVPALGGQEPAPSPVSTALGDRIAARRAARHEATQTGMLLASYPA